MTTVKNKDILRAVLEKLAQCRLTPNPENFSRVYREISVSMGLEEVSPQLSDMDLLARALTALEGLVIPNEELIDLLWRLRNVLTTDSLSEPERKKLATQLLQDIVDRKEQMLLELGTTSLEFKASMGNLIEEVDKLSSSITGFESSMSKYKASLSECYTMEEARSIVAQVLQEVSSLNKAILASHSKFGTVREGLQESLTKLTPETSEAPPLDILDETSFVAAGAASNASTACLCLLLSKEISGGFTEDNLMQSAIAKSIRGYDSVAKLKEGYALLLKDANFLTGSTVIRRIQDRLGVSNKLNGTLITFAFSTDRKKSLAYALETSLKTLGSLMARGGGFYPELG